MTRKRKLAPNTLARIEAGIRRYWGGWAEPFLVVLRGTGTTRSVEKPLPTVTAGGQHFGLVQPFMARYNGGDHRHSSVSRPIGTLDTSNRYGLIEPFLIQYYGNGGAESTRVPMATVTTRDRFALIQGRSNLDITFRMLQPRELARAQGFHDDYWFAGNKTEQIKQIGNAVPVNLAAAIAREALAA